MQKFDYIIAGGGMAGLSLAFYLNQSATLRHKKILILDTAPKTTNDRTWCFWERGESHPFEEIIFRKWKKIDFFSPDFSERFLLKDYYYKMLRGIDFYRFVHNTLSQNPNITFIYEPVTSISDTQSGATVTTHKAEYTADYVFDSIFKPDFNIPGSHTLLQHFKGWVIQTAAPHFESDAITLHDFRMPQEGDEARFFYLLPFSKHEALVEFTLFSPALLTQDAYNDALKKYISETLHLTDYTISETEFGVIPMSDIEVKASEGRHVLRIGTAGGYVRAATGYTFARTQRFLQKMVASLEATGSPDYKTGFFERRFAWYDSIMLKVLTEKRYPGAEFFSRLYQRNPIERIFDFLDEQSGFVQELRLMATAPWGVFFRAAVSSLFQRLFR